MVDTTEVLVVGVGQIGQSAVFFATLPLGIALMRDLYFLCFPTMYWHGWQFLYALLVQF